jgi:predicted nuclease of predicted toxin-antitoxin system
LRVKLDENIPALAVAVATQLGHDADTVVGENLTGATDADVLAAASRDERLLVTLDRGFGDIRAYPPGTHAGVVVLRVESQHAGSVTATLRAFLTSEHFGDLTGCLVVVRGQLVRIRRPE